MYDNNNWKRETKANKEEVNEGEIEEVDTYCYLGIMLHKKSNLKEHLKEAESKANRIIREINGQSNSNIDNIIDIVRL